MYPFEYIYMVRSMKMDNNCLTYFRSMDEDDNDYICTKQQKMRYRDGIRYC